MARVLGNEFFDRDAGGSRTQNVTEGVIVGSGLKPNFFAH
jgi:hypothetical protein